MTVLCGVADGLSYENHVDWTVDVETVLQSQSEDTPSYGHRQFYSPTHQRNHSLVTVLWLWILTHSAFTKSFSLKFFFSMIERMIALSIRLFDLRM